MEKPLITEIPQASLQDATSSYEQTDIALEHSDSIGQALLRVERLRGQLREELMQGIISEKLNAAIATADVILEKIAALQASKNNEIRVEIAQEINDLHHTLNQQIQDYRLGSGFEN